MRLLGDEHQSSEMEDPGLDLVSTTAESSLLKTPLVFFLLMAPSMGIRQCFYYVALPRRLEKLVFWIAMADSTNHGLKKIEKMHLY